MPWPAIGEHTAHLLPRCANAFCVTQDASDNSSTMRSHGMLLRNFALNSRKISKGELHTCTASVKTIQPSHCKSTCNLNHKYRWGRTPKPNISSAISIGGHACAKSPAFTSWKQRPASRHTTGATNDGLLRLCAADVNSLSKLCSRQAYCSRRRSKNLTMCEIRACLTQVSRRSMLAFESSCYNLKMPW